MYDTAKKKYEGVRKLIVLSFFFIIVLLFCW